MKTLLCTLTAIFFLSAIPLLTCADDKPVYIARRTTGTIYVDGNDTEQDWQAADQIAGFVFPWYEEGKQEQTNVRVLWDDEYLYVFFRCEDEHIAAHFYQRNSAPYRDDCVEVFIASNPDHPLWYANNELNCLGTWLIGKHKDDSNEYVIRDKVLLGRSHAGTINAEDDTDEYWTLEIGIPFESLSDYETDLPPKPGDIWGINFNRCGGDINQQFSQWTASQTDSPNFHRPQDFGRIVFSGDAVR